MILNVMQKHINKGKRCYNNACPIALALYDAGLSHEFRVYPYYIGKYFGDKKVLH